MHDLPTWVDRWCRAFLGAGPVEVLFVVGYLSEVVGVRLADGREVVVKRRADESGRTRHCVSGQKLLAEQGFPCPMPLTDVIFRSGFAVHAERLVGGGEVGSPKLSALSFHPLNHCPAASGTRPLPLTHRREISDAGVAHTEAPANFPHI